MFNNTELSAVQFSATKKDFYQIWQELLEVATKISNRWDPTATNETDPGIVLLKVATALADRLNYNIDVNTLEAFMPSAAQESSMRKLCEMMGTSVGYYKSAITDVAFTFRGEWSTADKKITIPAFTNIKDIDNTINYFTLEPITLSNVIPSVTVSCMEGTVVTCETDTDGVITLWQLDDSLRYFLPEAMIAENGLFITNSRAIQTNESSQDFWTRVDQLNSQELGSRVYTFGYDSQERLPYIQFPADIAALIGDGIRIQYTRTRGNAGNVAANTLSKLQKPSTWENKEGDEFDDTKYSLRHGAALNGSNIESIDEAYQNYKKTIGTFDTLVTCRDYMNKIYKLLEHGSYGNPLVSNSIVSDIRDDINRASTIVTYGNLGLEYINQSNQDSDQKDKISHFDIILYPYHKTTGLNSKEEFTKSFTLDYSSFATIKDELKNLKTISHTMRLPEVGDIAAIKNKVKLNAKISTFQKVGPVEQTEIKNLVKAKLYETFNMRQIDFGEELPFDSIIKTIELADPRIRSVALDEPELETELYFAPDPAAANDTGTKEPLIIKLDSKNHSLPDKELNGDLAKLLAANVLAGRVGLFEAYANFESTYTEIAAPQTVSINETDYRTSFIGQGVTLSSGTGVGAQTIACPQISRIETSNTINSSALQGYVIAQNEAIQFRRPNLRTKFTIPGYVNYYLMLNSDIITEATPAEFMTLGAFYQDHNIIEIDGLPKASVTNEGEIAPGSPNFVKVIDTGNTEYFVVSQEKLTSDNRALVTWSNVKPAEIAIAKQWQLVLEKSSITGEWSVVDVYYLGDSVGGSNTVFATPQVGADAEDIAIGLQFNGINYIITLGGRDKAEDLIPVNIKTEQGTILECSAYREPQPICICLRSSMADFNAWNAWLENFDLPISKLFRKSGYVGYQSGLYVANYIKYTKATTASNMSNPFEDLFIVEDTGADAKANCIQKNETYQLRSEEYLFLNYTSSKKQDDGQEVDYVINRILGPGTILKPNFMLLDSTAMQLQRDPDKLEGFNYTAVKVESPKGDLSTPEELPEGLYTLGADEQIEVQEFATVEIDDVACQIFWIRNHPKVDQGKKLFFPNNKDINGYYNYILEDGEYLFYTDLEGINIAYYGSGTKIECKTQLSQSTNSNEVTADEIFTFGSNADIPWRTYNLSPSYGGPMIITEYSYLSLMEGDTLTNLVRLEEEKDTPLDNSWQSVLQANYSRTKEEIVQQLETFNLDATKPLWEIRSILLLNMGPNSAQVLTKDDKKTNKITLYSNEEDSELVTLEPSEAEPLGLKSNLNLIGYAESAQIAAYVYNQELGAYEQQNALQLKAFTPSSADSSSNLITPINGHLNLLLSETGIINGGTGNIIAPLNRTEPPEPFGEDSESGLLLHMISPGQDSVGLIMIYVEENGVIQITANAGKISRFNSGKLEGAEPIWSWTDYKKAYDSDHIDNTVYTLENGMYILQIEPTITKLAVWGKSVGADTSAVISLPTWVKRGELNYQVLPLSTEATYYADCVTKILDAIKVLDHDNKFYYHAPILQESALDFNALNPSEHLLSPYSFYDPNNVLRKFVVSELDAVSLENNIEIARSSRR